jgi:hypothetical protein
MAPCLRYTFEECLERAGITDPNSADAELLCTPKDFFPEKISAATIAIIIYLFSKFLLTIYLFIYFKTTRRNSFRTAGPLLFSLVAQQDHCYFLLYKCD